MSWRLCCSSSRPRCRVKARRVWCLAMRSGLESARYAIPKSIVLATAAILSLLLAASGAVNAGRNRGWPSDLTPTVFIYLPVVVSEPTPTPEPRIHIHGRVVMEDGTGVADVGIYVGVTCNPDHGGWLVTTTDQEGYYEGETGCPFGHDETLRVSAVLEGYAFVPEFDCWRTYGYCPGKQTDFVAFPTPASTP